MTELFLENTRTQKQDLILRLYKKTPFLYNLHMISVTLQQAKATLNALVEKARAGEDVVLMRGSKVVAIITPLDNADLEVSTRLSDAQAEHFWEQVEEAEATSFSGVQKAVQSLKSRRS